MAGLNFLALIKDTGQRYLFFFDDHTHDAKLKRVWRRFMRDPELCFNQRDYDFLCERLQKHHEERANGTQQKLDEDDLGKLFEDDPDDECYGV